MDAYKSVLKCIEDNNLINKGDSLILGLSGGPDSLALLYILNDLKDKLSFKLYAMHLNHSIRDDADADMQFLIEECKKLDIELFVYKEDIAFLSKEQNLSTEDCGRKERQRLLQQLCERLDGGNCKAVLAHNSDDQTETVLMRIIRGCGIHGLSAMEYKRGDGLIRPLLDTKRVDIEKYCLENGLKPRIDKTNFETDYTRNKIRLELLPYLEKINPAIKESLVRLSNSAKQDDEYLEEIASEWYLEHIKSDSFVVKELRELPWPIYARVIKKTFYNIGLKEDIEAVHLRALYKVLLANIGNKTLEFPREYKVYINHGKAIFISPDYK